MPLSACWPEPSGRKIPLTNLIIYGLISWREKKIPGEFHMLHRALEKKPNALFSFVLSCLLILLALYLIVPFKAHASLNPIQQENQLPGTTSWQLTNPDSYGNYRYSHIEGYAWDTSLSTGNTLTFSVSTTAPTFTAEVYR